MEDPAMITCEPDKKSEKAKARKTVSFAEINQFFVIEYQEPIIIDEDRDESVNNDIESMISGDETSSSHVSFDALDKLSAGTAFDTTTFNAFPRRLSQESVGPAGFSMDDVIQKLLNIQACNALGSIANSAGDYLDSKSSSTNETVKIECDVPEDDESASESGISVESETSDGKLSPTDMSPLLNDSPNSKAPKLSLDSIIGSSTRSAGDSRRTSGESHKSTTTPSIVSTTSGASGFVIHRNLLSLESIISGGSTCESKLPVPELIAQVVATPRRQSSGINRVGSSPSESKRCSLSTSSLSIDTGYPEVKTPPSPGGTAPLTVVSSEKEGGPALFQGPGPDSPPAVTNPPSAQPIQQQQLSAAQFRRRERMNRLESVAIDMAKGVEKYSRAKLFYNVIVIWIILPSVVISLTYGVIPYDYFLNSRGPNESDLSSIEGVGSSIWAVTLIPWIVIMTATSALCLEIYSAIISEIEFGVIIWEEQPLDYLKACVLSVGASMAVQSLIFGVSEAGHSRNWLASITAGFIAIAVVMTRMFHLSSSVSLSCGSGPSKEARVTFSRFLFGMFVLSLGCSVVYTIFAIVYVQYGAVLNWALGYVLAIAFPGMKLFIGCFLENYPSCKWGAKRGQLCSVSTIAIIVSIWHGVFGCLVVTSSGIRGQFVLLAVSELICQSLAIFEILALPSTSSLDMQDLNGQVQGELKYKNDDRNPLQFQTSTSWRSKSSIVADFPSFHQFSAKGGDSGLTLNESSTEIKDKNELPGIDIRGSKYSVVSNKFNFSFKNSMMNSVVLPPGVPRNSPRSSNPFVFLVSLMRCTRARTIEDDSRELQLGTSLGITWLTGIFTPLSFLICSTVVCVGSNKRLFALKGLSMYGHGYAGDVSEMISDWEYKANLHRIWSLNVFRSDSLETQGPDPSHLVYVLIAMSLFHVILSILGNTVLSCRLPCKPLQYNSKEEEENKVAEMELGKLDEEEVKVMSVTSDVWGLMSALIEYHKNIIALSMVMTMAIVFSVVFPWYGMNASF